MTIKIEGSAPRINRTLRNSEYYVSLQVSEVIYNPNTLDLENPYYTKVIISLYHIDQMVGSFTRIHKMKYPPKFIIGDLYILEVCDLISDPEVSKMLIDHLTHRLTEIESQVI